MKIGKRSRFAITAAAAAAMLFASGATAALVVHEGKGPGAARLGQLDSKAAGFLGKHGALQRDANYGSRVVYWINFGARMPGGRYPCEMLSDSQHRVFQFSFNSPAYVTAGGIRVGSSEAKLKAAYPLIASSRTPKFTHYVWGKRPFTDFWVLNQTQRVYQIIVRAK
jgi:hypothetical protein